MANIYGARANTAIRCGFDEHWWLAMASAGRLRSTNDLLRRLLGHVLRIRSDDVVNPWTSLSAIRCVAVCLNS